MEKNHQYIALTNTNMPKKQNRVLVGITNTYNDEEKDERLFKKKVKEIVKRSNTRKKKNVLPEDIWHDKTLKLISKDFVVNNIAKTFDINQKCITLDMIEVNNIYDRTAFDVYQELSLIFDVCKYNECLLNSDTENTWDIVKSMKTYTDDIVIENPASYVLDNLKQYFSEKLTWKFNYEGLSVDESYYYGIRSDSDTESLSSLDTDYDLDNDKYIQGLSGVADPSVFYDVDDDDDLFVSHVVTKVDGVDGVDEVDEVDEVDGVDGVDEVDEVDEDDGIDKGDEADDEYSESGDTIKNKLRFSEDCLGIVNLSRLTGSYEKGRSNFKLYTCFSKNIVKFVACFGNFIIPRIYPEADMSFVGNCDNWFVHKGLLLPVVLSTQFT
jgi:hypothetical protein